MFKALGALGLTGGIAAVAYRQLVTGRLVIDTGTGRTMQFLGPLTVTIDAPREIVFDVIEGPYLKKTPRALQDEIEVLERGTDMVLAAHHTQVGKLDAITVETVRFERPSTVTFRLLRGPVPHVVETYRLREEPHGGTTLVYEGELGTDFGAIGAAWGRLVAKTWVATVDASLTKITAEAERRAASSKRARGL